MYNIPVVSYCFLRSQDLLKVSSLWHKNLHEQTSQEKGNATGCFQDNAVQETGSKALLSIILTQFWVYSIITLHSYFF